MSRRFSPAALAVLCFFIAHRVTFAASSAQAGTPNALDNVLNNPGLLFAIVTGFFLVLAVGGGIIGALIAPLVTRFFKRNVPPADKWTAFNAQENAALEAERARPRRKIKISPTLEPFAISIGGFLVVFILASMFVVVPPARGTQEPNGQTTPNATTGLPTSGDFTEVVAGLPEGNADNGVKLFTSQGCSGCHGLQKDQRLVGPSFYGLWNTAGTRKPGVDPKVYLYESIVNPNTHIVEGYQSGLMPPTFSKTLTPQDMADILAYIERDHNEE